MKALKLGPSLRKKASSCNNTCIVGDCCNCEHSVMDIDTVCHEVPVCLSVCKEAYLIDQFFQRSGRPADDASGPQANCVEQKRSKKNRLKQNVSPESPLINCRSRLDCVPLLIISHTLHAAHLSRKVVVGENFNFISHQVLERNTGTRRQLAYLRDIAHKVEQVFLYAILESSLLY